MNFDEAISIMQVSTEIKKDDLKIKYKKLVLKYHPDRNNGDAKKFLKIKDAYDLILKHINLREVANPRFVFDEIVFTHGYSYNINSSSANTYTFNWGS